MAEVVTAHAPFDDRIDPRIVAAQARVFAHFDIPLVQEPLEGGHGGWLNGLAGREADGVFCACDIDAFPLSRAAFDRAVTAASQGHIFGLAQVANQFDPTEIYAGPMFLMFERKVWHKLDRPYLSKRETSDPAQEVTRRARAQNVKVDLLFPSVVLRPQWPLADKGVFGLGTFYGDNEFFHLFQARRGGAADLVEAVADGAIRGKHDFARYLDIVRTLPEPEKGRWKAGKWVKGRDRTKD
jgi:hypothetical protein